MAVWPLPRITFRELSSIEEDRPVALLATDDVWAVLSAQLTLPVMIQAEPARYDRELFTYLADNLPSQVGAVYAVGTGAPIEAGKLIAARNTVPLVIVPTALDSAAMLLPTAQMLDRADDYAAVVTEDTGPADEIIIDWGVIQSAPEEQRAAGLVEVLSVVTGLLDWRYAAQQGKNPREERFVSWAASVASGLAKQAIKSAAAIGQGHQDALHSLLHLMAMLVQLNNQLEHARAQRGSEHYLAHALSAITEFEVPHSHLVAQSLLFAAALHGQDPSPMRTAMEQAHIPLDRVRPTDFALLLEHLEATLERYDFPYSILNDLDWTSEQVEQALAVAGLEVEPETWEQPGAAHEADPAVDEAVEVDVLSEADETEEAAEDSEFVADEVTAPPEASEERAAAPEAAAPAPEQATPTEPAAEHVADDEQAHAEQQDDESPTQPSPADDSITEDPSEQDPNQTGA